MRTRLIQILLLLVTLPLWSQVEPGATGGAAVTDNDTQMTTPPPVSGMSYPTAIGLETRSNYFSTAITVEGAYLDNLLNGVAITPTREGEFSIFPTVMLSRSTPRQKETLSYSPSFVIYEPSSDLDTIDQGASLDFQERLSPGVSISLQDSFSRTSNVFDQSSILSGGAVTGSTQVPAATVIAPFAEQLTNVVHGVLSYQFGRDGMLGGGGSFSNYDLPNSSDAAGLGDSSGSTGMAFYNRRLSRRQYTGMSYLYSRTVADSTKLQSETQTHSFLPFYSLYFTERCSFSISGGIQRVDVTQTQVQPFSSWSPAVVASVGWQASRANIAANYTHILTAGEGLLGAFSSNGVSISGGWQLSSSWNAAASFDYSTQKNVISLLDSFSGGTIITGYASLVHTFGEHLSASAGYERLHENYPGIAVVSENPDVDRAFGRISYEFSRPLGR